MNFPLSGSPVAYLYGTVGSAVIAYPAGATAYTAPAPSPVTIMAPAPADTASLIRSWERNHALTPGEVARLSDLIGQLEPHEVVEELGYELKAVLADRKLATMAIPTADHLRRMRDDFLAGRLPYKPRPLD